MIASLFGRPVTCAGSATVIIDVGGVGYDVVVSDRDRPVIRTRESVHLYVRTVMTEHSITLYGFLDVDDLALFRELCAVKGLSTGTAMRVLSVASAAGVRAADAKTLTRVPGIGPKIATTIVEALR